MKNIALFITTLVTTLTTTMNAYDLVDLDKDILAMNKTKTAMRESGCDYTKISKSGKYFGKYQMGKLALIEAGFIKDGARDIHNNKSWVKYDLERFMNSEVLQDLAYDRYTAKNYRYLKSTLYSEVDAYGQLCAAHLLGAFGAMNRNGNDANGATWFSRYTMCTRTYYNMNCNNYKENEVFKKKDCIIDGETHTFVEFPPPDFGCNKFSRRLQEQ